MSTEIQNVITDASGNKRTNNRTARHKTSTKNLESLLVAGIREYVNPVIAALDEDHPADIGTGFPSKTDAGLRIMLSNFCRSLYQQLHGVPKSDSYKGFDGALHYLSVAENMAARAIDIAERNGDDADPNVLKAIRYHNVSMARVTMLTNLLGDLKEVYRDITSEEWEYVAPGSSTTPVVNAAEKIAKFKAARSAA